METSRNRIEEVFGLHEMETFPKLEQWVAIEHPLSEIEHAQAEEMRLYLKANVDYWNEAELKMNFLGPFLRLFKYDEGKEGYRIFVERDMSVQKGEAYSTGKVDFLIAKGKQIPRSPFFCVHAYKPDATSDNDPIEQLLMIMLAAQQENAEKDLPIYGVHVIGRFFYFLILEGNNYAKTDAYVATQEDLMDIFAILKKMKTFMEQQQLH